MVATHLLEMKKNGYAPLTLKSHSSILRHLAQYSNLYDPEAIKLFVAEKKCTPTRKERICNAYLKFAKSHNIVFDRPIYQSEDKLPFVPLQAEIESILNFCKNARHSTYLRLAYESGARCGELSRLKYSDFDFMKGTVRITPEKHGRAREVKLSSKLVAQIIEVFNRYPDRPLPDPTSARKHLERIRKKLAVISCNPRLNLIHLHTLRHAFACKLYFSTKDLLYCQQQLGHRSLANTLRYARLIQFEEDPQYICKAATTEVEAAALIEHGFEYVTLINSVFLFRKRK